MLRLAAEGDEVFVVDDQRGSPTYLGHLVTAVCELVELPRGLWHLTADDSTWAEFATAIFEAAGLDCRVRRITTASSVGPHNARHTPSYEASAATRPSCPHWRDGLCEWLERLAPF
jgi:dTDP-4-dehydrorhamnose reductase